MTYEEYKEEYNKELSIMEGAPIDDKRADEAFLNVCKLADEFPDFRTMHLIENGGKY